MATNTYDPKKVSLIVNGLFITGYMDGTMISAEKIEDSKIPHVGAQGDVTITRSADETGNITVNLKQNSSSLPALIALAKQDAFFPVQVIDGNTNQFKAGGNEATILKVPAVEWGAEVSGVEIVIFVADYDFK